MAKRITQKVWMKALGKDDAAELGKLVTATKAEWSEWECKVRGDNIIVYVPITPLTPQTSELDPPRRYMEKLWRVAPVG